MHFGRMISKVEPLESRVLLSAAAAYGISPIAEFDFTNTGAAPNELLLDPNTGILYGTTQFGGPNAGNINGSQHDGVLFEVLPGATTITPLAAFDTTNGEDPIGSLVEDSAGDLFGTASSGVFGNAGGIWELPVGQSTISLLVGFGGAAGANPESGLTLDFEGNLFGTTTLGGANNAGTVFEWVNAQHALITLASFPTQRSTDVDEPNTRVVVDLQGNVYGVHQGGGSADAGYVYEVVANSDNVTDIHDFTASSGSPQAGLAVDGSGNIFGTTTFGLSSPSYGGIFEIPAGTISVVSVARFTGPNQAPGDLTIDSAGNVFGVVATENPKTHNAIFELPVGTHSILTLANFAGVTRGSANLLGALAPVGVAVDASRNIFGTYPSGGASGNGIIYKAVRVAAQMAFSQEQSTAVQNSVLAPITVSIEDAFGAVIAGNTSQVTLTLVGGKGVTLGGTTTVNVVNGVATFSDLTIPAAGHYTFTATDSTVTKSARSKPLAVTPIPIIPHIVVLQQPVDVAAGAKMLPAISIEVQDQFNNPVLKGQPPVKLTLVSGPAGAKVTGAAPLKAGIATFSSLLFKTAGAYTLQATEGTASATALSAFNVTPGLATRILFSQQPISTTTNAAFGAQVELEDKFNNIVTDDTSFLTLSLGGGPKTATLSGVLTANVIDGIATFTGLTLNAAGGYTLRATDSNPLLKAKATSKPFKIS